jgi:hypothetical protein
VRLCGHIGCEATATVWWKGPLCGYHADQRYGRVPMFVGQLEMSRRPPGGDGGMIGVLSSERPRPRRLGAEGFPSPVPPPVATSYDVEPDWLDAEFVALLEADV